MTKKEEAVELSMSIRGQYIISQALTKAIEVMEKEPETKREVSNIADMKFLLHNLFPLFYVTQKAEKEFRKKKGGGEHVSRPDSSDKG